MGSDLPAALRAPRPRPRSRVSASRSSSSTSTLGRRSRGDPRREHLPAPRPARPGALRGRPRHPSRRGCRSAALRPRRPTSHRRDGRPCRPRAARRATLASAGETLRAGRGRHLRLGRARARRRPGRRGRGHPRPPGQPAGLLRLAGLGDVDRGRCLPAGGVLGLGGQRVASPGRRPGGEAAAVGELLVVDDGSPSNWNCTRTTRASSVAEATGHRCRPNLVAPDGAVTTTAGGRGPRGARAPRSPRLDRDRRRRPAAAVVVGARRQRVRPGGEPRRRETARVRRGAVVDDPPAVEAEAHADDLVVVGGCRGGAGLAARGSFLRRAT